MKQQVIVFAVMLCLCTALSSAFQFSSYRNEFYGRVTIEGNDVLPLAVDASGNPIEFDDSACAAEMYYNTLRLFRREDSFDLVFCGSDGSINVLNEVRPDAASAQVKGSASRWQIVPHQARSPHDDSNVGESNGFFSWFFGSVDGRSTLCNERFGNSYRVPLSAEYALLTLPDVQQMWTVRPSSTSAIAGLTALLAADRGQPLSIEDVDGYSVLSIAPSARFPSALVVEDAIQDAISNDRAPPVQATQCASEDNEIRLIARRYSKQMTSVSSVGVGSAYITDIQEELRTGHTGSGDWSLTDTTELGLDFIQDPFLASVDQILFGVDGSRYEQEFFYPGNMNSDDKDAECAAQLGDGWAAATLAELQQAVARGFSPYVSSTFGPYEGPQLCGSERPSAFALDTGAAPVFDAFSASEISLASRYSQYCRHEAIVVRDTCTAVTPLAFTWGCNVGDASRVSPLPDGEFTKCQPVLTPLNEAVRQCRDETPCSGDPCDAGNPTRCSDANVDELPWSLTDLRPTWFSEPGDFPRPEDGDVPDRGVLACAFRTKGGFDGWRRRTQNEPELGCVASTTCKRRDVTDTQVEEFPVYNVLVDDIDVSKQMTLHFAAEGDTQVLRLPLNQGPTLLSEVGGSSIVGGGNCAGDCGNSQCTGACLVSSNCRDDAVQECPENFYGTRNEYIKMAAAGALGPATSDALEVHNPKFVRVPIRFLTKGQGSYVQVRVVSASGRINDTSTSAIAWVTGCGAQDSCNLASTPNPNFAGYSTYHSDGSLVAKRGVPSSQTDLLFPSQVFNGGSGHIAPSAYVEVLSSQYDCELTFVFGFDAALEEFPDGDDDYFDVVIEAVVRNNPI